MAITGGENEGSCVQDFHGEGSHVLAWDAFHQL